MDYQQYDLHFTQRGMTPVSPRGMEFIHTGLAWQLQGHYGRMAANLVDRGLVHIHAR